MKGILIKMITSQSIINTILKLSFKERKEITLVRLQILVYLTCLYYKQERGESLIVEPFILYGHGPGLTYADDTFKCYSDNAILKFAKNAIGDVKVIDKKSEVYKYIEHTWMFYKDIPLSDLIGLVRESIVKNRQIEIQGITYIFLD